MGSFGKPTINDVARLAGVSNMTVSRVVSKKGYISAKTQELVQAAIDELGYRPNELAKSMRTNSTRSIGFILPDITNTSNAMIAQQAEAIFARNGYRLVLGITGFSLEQETQFFSAFQQNTVDAVIAIIADETAVSTHELIGQSRVPVVLLNCDLPVPTNTVYIDDDHCVRDAVRHLTRLGHQRIALVTSPTSTRPGRLRHLAYQAALGEFGLNYDPTLVRLRHETAANGYQAALELMRLSPRPTALIVAASQIGLGVTKAIQELGLQVPHDVSIIGTDEGYATSVITPPLTAISRDMDLVGRHAAELMLECLADPEAPPRSRTVRGEIILRSSCDRPS